VSLSGGVSSARAEPFRQTLTASGRRALPLVSLTASLNGLTASSRRGLSASLGVTESGPLRRAGHLAALSVTLSRAEASSAASSLSSGLSAALVAAGLPETTVLEIAQSCGAGYERQASACQVLSLSLSLTHTHSLSLTLFLYLSLSLTHTHACQVCPRSTYKESSADGECIHCDGAVPSKSPTFSGHRVSSSGFNQRFDIASCETFRLVARTVDLQHDTSLWSAIPRSTRAELKLKEEERC